MLQREGPKVTCKVCEGVELRTANRLIGLGRGSRFVADRFPHLNRKDVKRHQERCFPQMRVEVEADLEQLARRNGF